MDERKLKILKSIIDDYIDTAEPVSSRTLANRHNLGLSSATIRNEMADLEDMGYLIQPHTSAGRIPSNKGYRLYVDSLMPRKELTTEETDKIRGEVIGHISELDQIMQRASKIISNLTNYTTVAVSSERKKGIIKSVQFLYIEEGQGLAVIITKSGIVKNIFIKISKDIKAEHLAFASGVFNQRISGLTLEDITISLIKEISDELGEYSELLSPFLNALFEGLSQIDDLEVIVQGTSNILELPEFKNLDKAKQFLNVLKQRDVINEIVKNSKDNKDLTIKIGSELDIEEVNDMSVVSTKVSLGDSMLGVISVIGPTRMEYDKVISSMNYLKKILDDQILGLLE